MVAEALDLTEGTSHDVSLGMRVHLETAAAQTHDLTGMENVYAPKVRKPYTIKKQREKWTEEEHQRFLEALKLYGRAWRQIEEHVGSKTAIQIRSHAQKFFAKVARDSNDGEGSLDPIDIPPPRPKKKPVHPYPRKVADYPKTTLVDTHQPEHSTPRRKSVEARTNMSPTSVISTIQSDTCESPFSGLLRSRLSPTSCNTADAQSVNLHYAENDNECMASDSSVEEEKECLHSIPMVASAAPDDKSTMELDLLTLGRACPVEDPATEPTSMTIKLFGRTVEVKENEKLSSSTAQTPQIPSSDSGTGKFDIRTGQQTLGSTTSNVDPQVSVPLLPSCITPLTCLAPTYALSEDCGKVSIPLWTWFHGPLLPTLAFCNQTSVETVVDSSYRGCVENKEPQGEGSSTGSNSGSVTGANHHRKLDAVQSKNVAKIEKQSSAKGFVPYKRCLAQRDGTSSIGAAEEREGQRVRVCS